MRHAIVDPINSALHRHLPRAIEARNLAAVLENYTATVGEGFAWDGAAATPRSCEEEVVGGGATRSESIEERYRRLFDLLPVIERAELRIHRLHWDQRNRQGYPAELHLVVRGMLVDGARAMVEQAAMVRVDGAESSWRITEERIESRRVVVRRNPAYSLVSEDAGIANVHRNDGSPVYLATEDWANASGSAVADVDRDGCEDAFLAGSPDAVLYLNNCDGTFTDVTVEMGLPQPYPDPATGVAFFDYDNDGWPDLYVAAAEQGDRLFRNDRGLLFRDVTEEAGVPRGRWASMPIIADYDRDGFLDVYIVRMGDHAHEPPRPSWEAHNGVPNTLLRNQGDGTFQDVTAAAGVGDTGWNLAGAWGDYDNDGWPDLYLGNEFGTNALYHNNGDGTFTERAREASALDHGAAMGVVWGDYDGDGYADVYISNMYANSRWATFHQEFPAPVPWQARLIGLVFPGEVAARTKRIFETFTRGSTLLRNNGDGTFTDVSDSAGVRESGWGWGAEFLDYDNDGRLDIYATNGFVTGPLPDDI